MKCLLVDDEPGIREGLATLLRRRGHDVRTAADCGGASALLGAQQFDVVVTDWRLPDGLAATFVAASDPPVIAVSGHPEEVDRGGRIVAVLEKPVTPARLLAAIAACRPIAAEHADDLPPTPGAVGAPALPCDVQNVLDDVLAQLPENALATYRDDGTFLVLLAALPDGCVPMVRHLGGDLRVLDGPDGRQLELRLCRDGRPDPGVRVVPADGPLPECSELAFVCHGIDVDRDRLAGWFERARLRAQRGALVRFLNVPEPLVEFTAGWEKAHDLPMRGRVGPCLPAEMADLWS